MAVCTMTRGSLNGWDHVTRAEGDEVLRGQVHGPDLNHSDNCGSLGIIVIYIYYYILCVCVVLFGDNLVGPLTLLLVTNHWLYPIIASYILIQSDFPVQKKGHQYQWDHGQ